MEDDIAVFPVTQADVRVVQTDRQVIVRLDYLGPDGPHRGLHHLLTARQAQGLLNALQTAVRQVTT